MSDIQNIVLILLFFSWPLDAEPVDGSSTNEEAKLICANVIFRHGSRNIIQPYSKDPWRSARHWPEGFGMLTQHGITQAIELGKYLRRRYDSILDDSKNVDDVVYVRSSNIPRTLMTASNCAAALFPPKSNQSLNKNRPWKPVSIFSVPLVDEYLFAMFKPCPRFNQIKNEYYQNCQELNAICAKYHRMMRNLSKYSGQPIKTLNDVNLLYNTLFVENDQNKTLPDWTKKVGFGKGTEFEWLSNQVFFVNSASPAMTYFSAGYFLREILQNFKDKIESKLYPDRSLWLYCGHDLTIATILNGLGLFEVHYPPYTSSIHFELYKTRNDHYLQIIYRNTSNENPLPMHIPGCGTKCLLNDFLRIYNEIIPTGEYEEECRLPVHEKILKGKILKETILEEKDNKIPTEYLTTVVCINIMLPICAIIAWKFFSRKRSNSRIGMNKII